MGSARKEEAKRLEDISSLERQIADRKRNLSNRPTDLSDPAILREELVRFPIVFFVCTHQYWL